MLQGYEIIVFSDELGRHPFSCQHIMEHYFDANRIIWVTPTGMRNPKLSLHDAGRVFEKVGKWLSGAKPVQTRKLCGPMQISPPALPYNDVALVRNINNVIVKSRVNKELQGGAQRIVITTLPITAEYVDAFNSDLIVYYIVDDFMEWPGINQRYIEHLEKMLLTKADLLIASAESLCLLKKGKNEPVFIPHGVDYEHFADSIGAKPPVALVAVPRPIIGFFGAISPWIDFKLLEVAVSRRPEWSFVFIGPADADVSRLKELDNVHFLGKIDYDDLPQFAAQFDVGIIPFVINDLTVSVNPLKLLEYFACGIPVVSTALPEVSKFGDHVLIGRDADEFLECLDQAVSNASRGSAERLRVARENSWRTVAERFSAAIERALDKP